MKKPTLVAVILAMSLLAVQGRLTAQSESVQEVNEPCECGCLPSGGWHSCSDGAPLLDALGPVHWVEEYGSCNSHGHFETCEQAIAANELSEFVETVESADPDSIRSAIDGLDGLAFYNADRGTIQVSGCQGRIIANLRIGGELALALDR